MFSCVSHIILFWIRVVHESRPFKTKCEKLIHACGQDALARECGWLDEKDQSDRQLRAKAAAGQGDVEEVKRRGDDEAEGGRGSVGAGSVISR